MNSRLERLFEKVDWSAPAKRDSELIDDPRFEGLFQACGGLTAFQGGLRVFGPQDGELCSFERWNDAASWRTEYRRLAAGLEFFAEDFLGNQFAFDGEFVVEFMAETGERIPFATSFLEWLERILANPDDELSLWLLNAWISNQRLSRNDHLCPKIPFIMGGVSSVENLYALNRVKSMVFKGSIAVQIDGLPSGTPIRLNVSRSGNDTQ